MMHITRCIKSGLSAFSRTPQIVQQRTFSALSSMPIRPTLLPTRSLLPASEVASSIVQPTSQTGLSILQVRGAKRDTFNPSHVVRKRRHGFLSRLRTRTGRMTLKRRRAKGRSTLSH